jgi:hypothetical protein
MATPNTYADQFEWFGRRYPTARSACFTLL